MKLKFLFQILLLFSICGSLFIFFFRHRPADTAISIDPQLPVDSLPLLGTQNLIIEKNTQIINQQTAKEVVEALVSSKSEKILQNSLPDIPINNPENKTNHQNCKLCVKNPRWKDSKIKTTTKSAGECHQTTNRDYNANPVSISTFQGKIECDVPCVGGQGLDGSKGSGASCPWTKTIYSTMENIHPAMSQYDIVATPSLDSDVPMGYFSWAEYKFMYRPVPLELKKAPPMMAMISNCGPQKRLDWLSRMQKAGVQIDSYGRCSNNMPNYKGKPSGYLGEKIELSSKYKFTFAAENSETDDYVTEKLFGTFVAGSVPVFMGAKNAQKFAPSSHSIIHTNDFASPEELAEYLLYLNSNDTAYEEYLTWKYDGPSKDFLAVVDLAIVHSRCRTCIRIADYHRHNIGFTKGHEIIEDRSATAIYIRERGKFWLKVIYLQIKTLLELYEAISELYPEEKGNIYSVYYLWDQNKTPFTTDKDVSFLEEKDELEIIFEDPFNANRFSYTEWQHNPEDYG